MAKEAFKPQCCSVILHLVFWEYYNFQQLKEPMDHFLNSRVKFSCPWFPRAWMYFFREESHKLHVGWHIFIGELEFLVGQMQPGARSIPLMQGPGKDRTSTGEL